MNTNDPTSPSRSAEYLLRESATAAIAKIMTRLVEDDPDVKAAVAKSAKEMALGFAKTENWETKKIIEDAIRAELRAVLETDACLRDAIRKAVIDRLKVQVTEQTASGVGNLVGQAVTAAVSTTLSDLRIKLASERR